MANPKGVFIPVLPLDVLILRLLPKEGTIFMGVYPEGPSVKEITGKIAGGMLPSSVISNRMRTMHMAKLAEKVTIPRQNTAGWQITPAGEQFVADHPIKEQANE